MPTSRKTRSSPATSTCEAREDKPTSALRRALKTVPFLRSAYHLLETALDIAHTRPQDAALQSEALYRAGADPWHYASDDQQARYRRALDIIDRAFAGRPIAAALEIGCGEGAFTQLLRPRCQRLVACDASPTALERARARVRSAEFRRLDILADELPGAFDLIVIDHVLDMFGRRSAYRAVAGKLARALGHDGYVLIGGHRAFDLAERAWWSRLVLRGGVATIGWIAAHSALQAVETVTESFYTYTLFRKRS